MSVLKLKPSCKDYLWGGHRLVEEYGKEYDGEILAETWELSCHPDGPSTIVNGAYAGKTLEEYIEAEGKEVLGTNCRRFRDFPILTKFIDAKQDLSIQVHPDNRYALKNEGQYGKTEMWYVVDAGKEAFLYYGFKKEVSKEEFARRIQEDTLLEVLNAVPVQKGDVLFIESGTIHAIGKDILIAEIQQNSNVTYRVYDYGRVGKDGKKRDLHIEKAIAVTNRVPLIKSRSSYPHVADCDYFTVDKLNLDGRIMCRVEGTVSEESFVSILILDGEGVVSCGNKVSYQKGDSLFLPAGSGAYVIEGSCDALITTIRAKAAPVRIGIDIGGTNTVFGIVDARGTIIASSSIKTAGYPTAEEYADEVCKNLLPLIIANGGVDKIRGIGVGAPNGNYYTGTIEFAPNLPWRGILPLAAMFEERLGIPTALTNDANAAAIGEMTYGAARGMKDFIMITLGTGVGSGIVINGQMVYGHDGFAGELGHVIARRDGRICGCGRKGCLETYCSATGVARTAREFLAARTDASLLRNIPAESITSKDVYDAAVQGDKLAQEIFEFTGNILGEALADAIAFSSPEAIVLFGGLAKSGDYIMKPIMKSIDDNVLNIYKGKTKLLVSELKDSDAAVLGASALAWELKDIKE